MIPEVLIRHLDSLLQYQEEEEEVLIRHLDSHGLKNLVEGPQQVLSVQQFLEEEEEVLLLHVPQRDLLLHEQHDPDKCP